MLSSWARISRQYRILSCSRYTYHTLGGFLIARQLRNLKFHVERFNNNVFIHQTLACIQCEFKVICERQQMNSEGCEVKQKTRTFMNILPENLGYLGRISLQHIPSMQRVSVVKFTVSWVWFSVFIGRSNLRGHLSYTRTERNVVDQFGSLTNQKETS